MGHPGRRAARHGGRRTCMAVRLQLGRRDPADQPREPRVRSNSQHWQVALEKAQKIVRWCHMPKNILQRNNLLTLYGEN